jgi:hypothetical protein
MSTSNLKPSNHQLESNLEQYRMGSGTHLSNLEFDVIQKICRTADKAMRITARTALAQAPEHLKINLFPTLTAGNSPIPMATQVGHGGAYRISIPISFVGKLLEITPTRGGQPAKDASDYFISSTVTAVLAAYGHEINHIFAGHLGTPSSIAQETHSDYIGGGLLWAWLHDREVASSCQIANGRQDSTCLYGFLHLISALIDSDHDQSPYLPRCLRLGVFTGGAGFYADQRGGSAAGELVRHAFKAMPACPDIDFDSVAIRRQYHSLTSQMEQPQMLDRLSQALQEMCQEKFSWYTASEHLRPIKKDLMRALKRDTPSTGRHE